MVADIPSPSWVPASCTLPSAEVPLRLAEFDQFFAASVLRWARPEPTVLELVLPQTAEAAGRDLAGRESACCSFFGFSFEQPAAERVLMRISVPVERVEILDAVEEQVRAAHSAHGGGS